MDFLKYFTYKYKENTNNCWEFVCYIYKNEHNYELPKLPIADSNSKECTSYLKSNINLKLKETAKIGDLIHSMRDNFEHIGYAINNKKYIHLSTIGVKVTNIPSSALIYEVIR